MKWIVCFLLFLSIQIFHLSQSWAQKSLRHNQAIWNEYLYNTNPALARLNKAEWEAKILAVKGGVASTTGTIGSRDLFDINANFLRQRVLGTKSISTGSSRIEIDGPSLAYGLTSKLTLAVSTRIRFFANYWNADGRLISEIGEIIKVPQEYPYLMKHQEMKMTASAFSDVGLSASYPIYKSDHSTFSVGISVNLLSGIANTSISASNLTGKIKRINSYLTGLTDASGQVETRTSGELFSNVSIHNILAPRKTSLSASGGIVYTFSSQEDTPYLFMLGLSLNDAGYVNFVPDSSYSKSYKIHIPSNESLFFNNNFKNSTFSQTTKVFDKYPEFFGKTEGPAGQYRVRLPTTLQVTGDIYFTPRISLSTYGIISMSRKNDISILRTNSRIMIVPAWHGRNLRLAPVFGFQDIGGFSSGVTVNWGPMFISSSTLVSSTFRRTKQLDLTAGIILKSSFLK